MAATVSARRQALADIARARHDRDSTAQNLRTAAVGLAIAILLVASILWLAGFFSTPREVLAVRALVDERVAELGRVARNEIPLSYEGDSFRPMFETMRQVPEAYREQARQEIGRLFEARETAEVDSFFGMPPERRTAELDRRIRAEEERRKAWQARRDEQRSAAGDGRPSADGGSGRARTDGGGRPAGGWGNATEEGRNQRAKARIDRSTAESRARRTEYRRQKDQRRIELGLSPGR
ncbi:MAG: hypothetical protein ACKOCX_07890 [Planctomycetota bacterium]